MGFMCNQLKLFVLSSEFWLVALGKLGIFVLGNKFKVGPFWLGWGPGPWLKNWDKYSFAKNFLQLILLSCKELAVIS